ncbi:MAG: adenylate kinase family protein [Thaumarchaeota archaeon]|nr:adenylate kinase family protein [Nitrososphaerota archaeon]
MPPLVAITGTPGTGKKTVAPLVASALGVPCFPLDGLASSRGLISRGAVDTGRLKASLKSALRDAAVVYGHLAPYVLDPAAVRRVVVLRCDPKVLKKRLLARGYPPAKVHSNVEAELIGVVLSDSYGTFGKGRVSEFDTTRAVPAEAARKIVRLLEVPPKGNVIDWTENYASAEKLMLLLAQP